MSQQQQVLVSPLFCKHDAEKWVFDYDANEVVCSRCGKVLDTISDSIVERDRWLMFRLDK